MDRSSKQTKHVTFEDFVSIPSPKILVVGRLRHFRKEWEKVTSDPEILKIHFWVFCMISGLSEAKILTKPVEVLWNGRDSCR